MVDSTQDPFELLLSRLPRVQRLGPDSARAGSPLSTDKHSRSVAINRGRNGTVLFHDHANRSVQENLAAIGLTVSDLYIRRDLRTMSPAERHQLRQASLVSKVQAATNVLSFEAHILLQAACKLGDGEALTEDEQTRIRVAALKVNDCIEAFSHAR